MSAAAGVDALRAGAIRTLRAGIAEAGFDACRRFRPAREHRRVPRARHRIGPVTEKEPRLFRILVPCGAAARPP